MSALIEEYIVLITNGVIAQILPLIGAGGTFAY